MAMSDKDHADLDAASKRAASAEDGKCNSGVPATPTDPPKRRFWQIHLSTAVVLMFVAGVMLGVNLKSYPANINTFNGDYESKDSPVSAGGRYFGWPMVIISEYEFWMLSDTEHQWHRFPIKYIELVVNVCTAFGILVLCAAICETTIRRREARKP